MTSNYIKGSKRSLKHYFLKRECRHSFKDYLINLMNGHIFLVPLWFQNNLILLTVLSIFIDFEEEQCEKYRTLTLILTIIIFSFKNNYIYIFHILSFLAIISQYSGFNYTFFKDHFSNHSYACLGRLTESFPNAIIGFSLAKYDIKKIIRNNSIISLYSFIILILISKYNIFSDLKTFKYAGIRLNIAAICIFIIFSSLPFQKIKNKILINGIIKITHYTAGIYFTHFLIGNGYFFNLLFIYKRGTLLECIFIYFLSYCICFIGSKLLGKTQFRHLFA